MPVKICWKLFLKMVCLRANTRLKKSANALPLTISFMPDMENIKLYATRSAQNLGEAIATHLKLPLNLTQAEKFSDGELFVKFNESVRGQIVLLIGKIHTPYENFFELLMTIDAGRTADRNAETDNAQPSPRAWLRI
jgi:hypothetical protein